jgi:hypothetical protein
MSRTRTRWNTTGTHQVCATPTPHGCETSGGGKYLKLQISTVQELLSGKKPDLPPMQPLAFSKAAPEPRRLFGTVTITGMIFSSAFAIFLTPVLFVRVERSRGGQDQESPRVKAKDLIPKAKKLARSSAIEAAALRDVLDEVHYADALIARESPRRRAAIDRRPRQYQNKDVTLRART